MTMYNLNPDEKETLIALVEKGPLWDGDVPSKAGRDGLVAKGLCAKVVVSLNDGWQAATYRGRDVYISLFPGKNGPADTIHEAHNNRKLAKARNPVREYYYRVPSCTGHSPDDFKCICWHTETTGPLPAARYPEDKNILHWRNVE